MKIEERIEEIKRNLIKQGYLGKKITYTEAQQLHQTYFKEMPEKMFFDEVLEMFYSYNYYKAAKDKTTIIVLNESLRLANYQKRAEAKFEENQEVEQETLRVSEIQEILYQKGYDKRSINYEELQSLYQTYGAEMEEKDFALKVLNLTLSSYRRTKNDNAKAKIYLKEKSALNNTKIQRMLLEQGYRGKWITYIELQDLHQTYAKQIQEKEFARNILQIPVSTYKAMIKNPTSAKQILKKVLSMDQQKEIQNSQEKLAQEGYAKKTINYEELQRLYQTYGTGMPEEKFAILVLQLHPTRYKQIMQDSKEEVKILWREDFEGDKEKIKGLRQELKEQGYEEALIDYLQFQELHQTYANNMEERRFALEVLGMSYDSYAKLKTEKGRKAVILKKRVMTKKEIKQLQNKMKEEGHEDELIDYQRLQEIHQMYANDMNEGEFARKILEIKNYSELAREKVRVTIFRNKEKYRGMNSKEIKKIQQELKEQGYDGAIISYQELKKLHQQYGKGIAEVIFAHRALELQYTNYRGMQEGRNNGKILGSQRILRMIKAIYLKESRYYTKEEVEEICQENEISIDVFIEEFLSKAKNHNEEYKDIISQGKVWIGRTKLSDNFIENHIEEIKHIASEVILDVKKRQGIDYNRDDDDRQQEAIWWVLENSGQVEKNFGEDDEEIHRYFYNSIRRHILYCYMLDTAITRPKTLSLQKPIVGEDEIRLGDAIASDENTEEKVLKRIDRKEKKQKVVPTNMAEKCIEELKRQIESGASKEEALKNTAERLNLGQAEMLQAMQEHLVSKGQVKIEKTGKKVSWSNGDGPEL